VILFIAAEPRECAPWVGHWDSVRALSLPVHWARAGKWKGADMIAIANGAGPERARAAVQASPSPAAICNIGFCGALDPSLSPGEIFVATEVRNGKRRYAAALPPNAPDAKSGVLASQRRIACTAAEKHNLFASGAFAIEMEAAGAASASEELKVPFYCVRAVSDLANEDFANDFNVCLMPDGRINVARLLFNALKSPVRRFGELIRLSQRTAIASRNLGEFLADCDF
jgi:adenosylhomocysteine nucleosidase